MSDGQILERLQTTQNPFAWDIDSLVETCDKLEVVSYLKTKEERLWEHLELPRVCIKINMAYLYATSDNLKVAESLLNECENIISIDDRLMKTYQPAFQHVLNATKAHFALLRNNTEEALKLVQMISCADAMEQQQQAALWVIRGLTLACVSRNGKLKGLEYVKKAMELDNREPEWCLIFGYLMSKVRRLQHPPTPPSQEEIDRLGSNFRRNKSGSTSIQLARAYMDLSTYFFLNKERHKAENYKQIASDMFKETLKLNKGGDPHEMICCARGLLNMGKENRGIAVELMKKALEKAPNDSHVNHYSGLISMKLKKFKDARKYLRTSLDGGCLTAGFSLIQVESSLDPQFSAEGLYEQLLDKFSCTSGDQATIYFNETLYLLFKKRNFIEAIKTFTRAVELGSTHRQLRVCRPNWISCDDHVNLLELFTNDIHYCLRHKASDYSPENLEAMSILLGLLKKIAPDIVTNVTPTSSRLDGLFEYDASRRAAKRSQKSGVAQ